MSDEIARGTLILDVQMNNTQLQQKIDSIAARMRQSLEPATQRIGAAAGDNLHQGVEKGSAKIQSSLANLARSITNTLGGAVTAVGKTLGSLGVIGGTALIGIATKAIASGVQFNILQQKVLGALTTVLGTSAAAQQLLHDVNKLNDTSPFPRSAFLEATQQLIAFGVAAKDVVPILDAIQKAVASQGGSASDIAGLTQVFAQIQSIGHVTGDTLLSLRLKGIDAVKVIAEQTGKTTAEVQTMISNGTLTARTGIKALTDGMQHEFGSALDNLTGSFGTASDKIQSRLRNIGGDLTKAFVSPTGGGALVESMNIVVKILDNIRTKVVPQLLPAIQSIANEFVKVSQAVLNFTNNLKPGQIKEILGVFQTLAPVIALVATNFASAFGGAIPFIGPLLNALNGPVIALGVLAVTVPEVRNALLDMGKALAPLIKESLPLFKTLVEDTKGVFLGLGQVIELAASAVGVFAAVAAPLLKLLNFGPITLLLELFIGKIVLAKIAGTSAFTSIATSVEEVTAAVGLASIGVTSFAGAMEVAGATGKLAMGGIGAGLKGLITPANIAILAIIDVTNRLEKAKRSAQETTTKSIAGLDFNKAPDIDLGNKALQKQITDQEKIIKDSNTPNLVEQANPWSIRKRADQRKAAENAIKDAKDQLKTLDDVNKRRLSLGAGVGLATGETVDEVIARAQAKGIDITTLRDDQLLGKQEELIKAFKEEAKALSESDKAYQTYAANIKTGLDLATGIVQSNKAIRDSEQKLADLRTTGAEKAALGVSNAEISLQQARNSVVDATRRLADLEQKRNDLLRDTQAGINEVKDAEEALAKGKANLIDIDEKEQELNRNIADTAATKADQLAAGDRSILRAKLALTQAIREEQALLNKKGAQLNLQGLTPEQIRVALANRRAQLEANGGQAPAAAAQIAAEAQTSARLNTLDAEQALRDATKSRSDLEKDIGIKERENAEALRAISLEREDALRRQGEAQLRVTNLTIDGTNHAKDLRDIDFQIRDAHLSIASSNNSVISAQEARTAALRTQKQLSQEIADADVEAKNAVIEKELKMAQLNKDYAKANSLLAEQFFINLAASQQPLPLQRSQVNSILPSLLSGATGIVSGVNLDVNAPSFEELSKTIADQILNTPGTDIIAILKQILRSLGLEIKGLAAGGLVEGTPGPMGRLHRLGEFGRMEAVLPLEDRFNLERVLNMPQVLNPVLDALPRITLPTVPTTSFQNNAPQANEIYLPNITRGSRISGQEQISDADMAHLIARAIVEEMQKAGMDKKSDNTFTFNVDQQPNAAMSERAMQRAVEEALKGV